uniref:Uncharacterized protein n=1 Tax=Vespula pensylvanica TaxID=30213 RepID=A0A834PB94_VESPE|nr:hypothetical protein H0235_002979 [Vespula pensylvanica]
MDRAEDEAIAGLPTNGNTPPLSELLAMVVVVRIPAGGSIDFQLASIRSPYSPEISVREIPAGAWKHVLRPSDKESQIGNTKLSNRKLVSSSKANRWIGGWFKAGPFEQSKYREGMESGSERSSVGQLFLVQRYPGRSKWHTDCSLDNGRPSSLAWSALEIYVKARHCGPFAKRRRKSETTRFIGAASSRKANENVDLMGYEFISLDPILIDLAYKVTLGSSSVGGVTLRPRV